MEGHIRSGKVPTSLEADVCIVGAGPAGLVTASRLVETGTSVVVLESGTAGPDDAEAQALNQGEPMGASPIDLRGSRFRGIGGTARIWNMAAHGAWGAKYLPLDGRDFEPHPYLPDSGWPFAKADLEAYYLEAERICLIDGSAVASPAPLPPVRGSALAIGSYRFGRATPFVATMPSGLAASPLAWLVSGATATGCDVSPSGAVRQLWWRGVGGGSGVVRARSYVLAAGGIENARLLLHFTSAAGMQGAPGTAWIGQGLMEHPVDRGLVLHTRLEEFRRVPSWFETQEAGPGRATIGRVALAAGLLDTERLPNASVSVLEAAAPAALRHEGARSAARRLVPLQPLHRIMGRAIAALSAGRRRGPKAFSLQVHLEQAPNRENAVRLSSRVDWLGVPLLQVAWEWSGADRARHRRLRQVLAREFELAGLGRISATSDDDPDPNAHHHAGTTRLHTDPSGGVAGPDGKVHCFENVYVTGGSVFPAAGFANPTLTVVALAARLADRLQSR